MGKLVPAGQQQSPNKDDSNNGTKIILQALFFSFILPMALLLMGIHFMAEENYGPAASRTTGTGTTRPGSTNMPHQQQRQLKSQASQPTTVAYQSPTSTVDSVPDMESRSMDQKSPSTTKDRDGSGGSSRTSSYYEWVPKPLTVITASGRPESQAKRADDAQRKMFDQQVQEMRANIDAGGATEPMAYVNFGNQLVIRDRLFNGGGIDTDECVWAYDMALELLMPHQVYPQVASLTCTVNSNQAEAYFMADMFEDSVRAFTNALKYKCNKDAASKAHYLRGSTYLILGKYEEATADFLKVYNENVKDIYYWRVIEKLTRILEADESAVPNGWEWLKKEMTSLLPVAIQMHANAVTQKDKDDLARGVQLVHVGLFHYYDKRTTDVETAEYHLDASQIWKRRFAEHQVDDLSLENDFQFKVGSYGKPFFDSVKGLGNSSPIPIYGEFGLRR